MSYHFGIKKNKDFTFREVLGQMKTERVEIAHMEDDGLDEQPEVNYFSKFYIPYRSTRGITLSYDGEEYDIGINVLSSKEDYLMAVDLAAAVARLTESGIEPEDREGPLSLEQFNQDFDDEWAEGYKLAGVTAITHMVRRRGDLTMGGCLLDYHIGNDIVDQLTEGDPDEEELYQRLMKSIRRVQFISEDFVRVPNLFTVTPKDEGEPWEYIVIIPDGPQLLRKTEFVILMADQEDHLRVPFERMESYAKVNWERLDERQYIVPDMAEEVFRALMEVISQS